MKNSLLTTCLTLCLTLFSSAHEFWLEPESFRPTSENNVAVKIKVGMNYAGGLWKGQLSNITALSQYHGGKVISLISEPLTAPTATALMPSSGQYLLGLTNKSSFIEMSASDFEKYVISEGLETIVEQRKELRESELEGRELYRRCVKTLIQKGESKDGDAYKHIFGFPLELVALDDPYAPQTNELLSFKLLFRDRPLSDAKIVVWNQNGETLKKTELRTKADGTIDFLYRPKGKWMLSVVHMERIEDGGLADWQSYWGSYTFGF